MFEWPTLVLDIASNHNGSVKHGLDIIRAHAEVVHKHGVTAAIKFQFRDLDHYRHGDERYEAKFKDCALSEDEYYDLIGEVIDQDMMVAGTAFDPSSATKWLSGSVVQIAKVASCSAKDTETLDAIIAVDKPTIISTGGLELWEAEDLIDSLTRRVTDLAVMHCVALYPTPLHRCDLIRIPILLDYGVPVGWSTHEDPNAVAPVMMAVAYGATIFERHIALGGDRNGYSSSPAQLDRWIRHYRDAVAIAGEPERGDRSDELAALKRVARRHQRDAIQGGRRIGGEVEGGAFAPSRP